MADYQLTTAYDFDGNKYLSIPDVVLKGSIPDAVKGAFTSELARIRSFYKIYEKGADFTTEGTKGDYIPSSLFYKKCRKLIDDEARFMFSNTPDMLVKAVDTERSAEEQIQISILNKYISKVLEKNKFASKLIKAAKDCFISGRVCVVANFNDEGIQIDFVNALEFYYEYDKQKLTKLVLFYYLNAAYAAGERRIRKKTYVMSEAGTCIVQEFLYDGAGELLEESDEINTMFPFIPAAVIFNDGLTGDMSGESEIDIIDEFESYYAKLSNADKDTLRKSMNSIKFIIDGSAESTKDLGTGPGVIWDLQSDIEMHEGTKAVVGQLEPSMNYKDALKNTLTRIDNSMHEMLSVPNINSEQLSGVITSGKTLRALYWPMVVRCNEKSNAWKDALIFLIEAVIAGGKLVPQAAAGYLNGAVPDMEFQAVCETNYALPDDEGDEKSLDLQEVSAMTMSRKSYMKKWRGLTDEEADAEIQQILFEKQLLDDGMFDSNAFGSAAVDDINNLMNGEDQKADDAQPTGDGNVEDDAANEDKSL